MFAVKYLGFAFGPAGLSFEPSGNQPCSWTTFVFA